MSQAYITLGATVLGMIVYGGVTIKRGKAIRAEDLLTFAMWCGAIVTGPYMVRSAFNLSKRPGEQANVIYVAIFGTYLFLLACQKLFSMVRKRNPRTTRAPQSAEENLSEKTLTK